MTFAVTLAGCPRRDASRELAPMPPVEGPSPLTQSTPRGSRLIEAVTTWVDELSRLIQKGAGEVDGGAQPQMNDDAKAAFRLDAARKMHLVLPLLKSGTEGAAALKLSTRIAAAERDLGAVGADVVTLALDRALEAQKQSGKLPELDTIRASASQTTFELEVAGLSATYRNTAHGWSVRYPLDWLIGSHTPDATRIAGSYLGLIVPVAEGPVQAGLLLYSVKTAEGAEPWETLRPLVVRALGTDPGAARAKTAGRLELRGETAYYTGETKQGSERVRFEVWVVRGQSESYAVIALSPVARWFEIKSEVIDVLEGLSLP